MEIRDAIIEAIIKLEWLKALFTKMAKPYHARYKFDNTIGFYKDENDCPLCPKCLNERTSTPGRYIGKRKMSCPVHGEVNGAESVSNSKLVTIDISEETADEVLITRKWENPEGEVIMPIEATSTEVIKSSHSAGGVSVDLNEIGGVRVADEDNSLHEYRSNPHPR